MSKILTDDIIPELKEKISTPTIKNVAGQSMPGSGDAIPTFKNEHITVSGDVATITYPNFVYGEGSIFRIISNELAGVAKININNSGNLNFRISTSDGSTALTYITLTGTGYYHLTIAGINSTDCMIIGGAHPQITTSELANGAVTAAKADVAGIMNSAGDNGQLFGLGGKALDISNTDLNNLPRKTGFYKGLHMTNAPWDDGWLIEQIVYDNDQLKQVARAMWSDNDVFQRSRMWSASSNAFVWSTWTKLLTSRNALNQLYPVGTTYMSATLDTPAKVASALGGGTWVATNLGQAIVGYDSTQSEFNYATQEGGAKTVTLTTDQMPSHTHGNPNGTSGWVAHINSTSIYPNPSGKANSATTAASEWLLYTTLPFTGGSKAHNNLQPYKVLYIYRRTA